MREQGWNWNGLLRWETSKFFNCEKYDIKYLGAGVLHYQRVRGSTETGARKHFYGRKLIIGFRDERELKLGFIGSSERVAFHDCYQEFPTLEAPELLSKQG